MEFKYALAIGYAVIGLIILSLVAPVTRRGLAVFIATFTLLVLVSILNDVYVFIEEKVASTVAYTNFLEGEVSLTFMVQYILVYLPFAIFDYEFSAHALNLAIQALVFMLSAQFIFPKRWGWKVWLFLLFPAFYNFSIFGLRDPLINLASTIIVISALHTDAKTHVKVCLAMAVVLIGLRPEFAMIVGMLAALRYAMDLSRDRQVMIAILGLVVGYVGMLLMPMAFGLSPATSLNQSVEMMVEFNERRHDRRLGGDGSGSHILGGSLFYLPIFIRYPIQVVASFVAPLPFEIRGGADLLAFGESVLFTGIAVLAFLRRKRSRIGWYLFWCGMIYMLAQAFFAINYGNILRIRYPCFVLFVGSLMAHETQAQARPRAPARRPAKRRMARRPASARRAYRSG